MPAQSREQTSDASEFTAIPRKAILENIVFRFVDDITLPCDDRRQDIRKVLDEADKKTQGARNDRPSAKFHAQLIHDLERMEAGCYHHVGVDVEVDHPETFGIIIEFKMQVPEDPRESAVGRLQADVHIGIKENFARARRNSFACVDPFLHANIGQIEMEPNRAVKFSIRIAGDVPVQRLGDSVLAELEAAD